MQFTAPLIEATLIRRYKRFLADVVLADGQETTVHCPNTGAMLGCCTPGARVWLSRADNPQRKYPLSWELVEADGGALVGIHTGRTNALVAEAFAAGRIDGVAADTTVRREVTIPGYRSRFDFLLEGDRPLVVEVKNVTAAASDGIALFPDAVSTRATRHVQELQALRQDGWRTMQLYCVQREDVDTVQPAVTIDPAYAAAVAEARAAGVLFQAWGCSVSTEGVEISRRLQVTAAE